MRTRGEILDQVWDPHWYGPTKTLDVHVASLRKKLGDPGIIETVRGVGFRVRDDSQASPARDGRPVTRRLVLSYLAITALVLAVLMIPLGVSNQRRQLQEVVSARAGRLRAGLVRGGGARDRRAQPRCRWSDRALRRRLGSRVVVVDADGDALLDTEPPEPGERDLCHPPGGPGRPDAAR